MLIREVAYAGLSKAERAELHGRFADWLRERAGDELLEIRAYHLDHAAQLLVELDGAHAAPTSRTRRPSRSRRRAGARSPASRTVPAASCCCAPSSSSRRSSAATRRRAPRGG